MPFEGRESFYLTDADDIKDRLRDGILRENRVTDVIVQLDEDEECSKWEESRNINKIFQPL